MFQTLVNTVKDVFAGETGTVAIDVREALAREEEEARKVAARLEEKRKQALSYLGDRWIAHPVHTQKGPLPNRTPRVLDRAGK